MKNTQDELKNIGNLEYNNTAAIIEKLKEEISAIKKDIQIHKKTTKNAIKLSIIVGVTCFFFVALNLSILFTIAGGIAGGERKLQSLQEQTMKIKEDIKNIKQQN